MDDVKFGAIAMALGTSEQPDSDLRLLVRLISVSTAVIMPRSTDTG
ncbi:hypothetical protein OHA51_48110 [Streptomyces sp. NBC_00589]|nr:hypothetical protein [Streptomyces sp. NBC_00589]WUB32549.1 hypothetical protein OHA51_48110 [Streptomyces sp. NBC_00589]